jgi:RNA polymerase sigma factor (sigma-70 family)
MSSPAPRPADDEPTDAALARAAAAQDRDALAAIFDRHAPRLLAYCRALLRGGADAEDCLQDVFVIAATRLSGLREPERLRSWLFAVARHECMARISRRGKEVPVDTIPDSSSVDADEPATAAAQSELARLVDDAFAGLSERDRILLDLADRRELPTVDVAAVLGLSVATTHKLLARARAAGRRALGALTLARAQPGECGARDAILADWDGRLTPLLRKRLARHLEDCDVCGPRDRALTSATMLGVGPAVAVVPLALRTKILAAAQAMGVGGAPAGSPSTAADPSGAAADPIGAAAEPADSSGAAVASSARTAAADWPTGWPPGSGPPHSGARVGMGLAALATVVLLSLALLAVAHRSRPAATARATRPSSSASADASPFSSGGVEPVSPRSAARARGRSLTSSPRVRRSGARVAVAPPAIVSASVTCVPAASAVGYVPVLRWITRHDTGITLSVAEPDGVGSYGRLGPRGELRLPPLDCAAGLPPQIYTLTTVGGVGPAAQRVIRWTPPIGLPSLSLSPTPSQPSSSAPTSPTASPSPSSSTTQPIIQ